MAWTTPKTWSVGETLTAANFNTHIRDNQLSEGPHLIARKTADETVASSTVLQNDDHLSLTVGTSEVWQGRIILVFTAVSVAAGIRVGFTFPAGTLTSSAVYLNAAGTLATFNDHSTSTPSLPLQFGAGATGSSFNIVPVDFHFVGSGAGGTVQVQWAQTTSNVTGTVLKANSTLWAVKLA